MRKIYFIFSQIAFNRVMYHRKKFGKWTNKFYKYANKTLGGDVNDND